MNIQNLMRLKNFDFHVNGQKHRPLCVIIPPRTILSGKVDGDGDGIPMTFPYKTKVDGKVKTVHLPIESKPVILAYTEKTHYGVYASVDMVPGDVVSPYVGDIIDHRKIIASDVFDKMKQQHFLSLRIGTRYIIDGKIDTSAAPGEKCSIEWYAKNGVSSFLNSMKPTKTSDGSKIVPNCKLYYVMEKLPRGQDVANFDFPEVDVPFPATSKRLVAFLVVDANVKAGDELHWNYSNRTDNGGYLFEIAKLEDRTLKIPLDLMRRETHGDFTLLYAKDPQAAATALAGVKIKPDPDAQVGVKSTADTKAAVAQDEDDDDDDGDHGTLVINVDEDDHEVFEGEANVVNKKAADATTANITALATATGMPMAMVQAFGQMFSMMSGAGITNQLISDAATDSSSSAAGAATKNPRGILKNKTPDQAGPDLSSKKRKTNELEASDETGASKALKTVKEQNQDLIAELTEKNQKIAELEADITKLSAEKEDLQKQYDALMPRFGSLAGFIQHLHDETGKMMNITNAAKKT